MRVGFLGPSGTFSEEATILYFANQDVERIAFPTFLDILEALQDESIDWGVLPVENSIEGTVNAVLDGIPLFPDLFIKGQVVLNVDENLLALHGVNMKDIKEVWSHAQPLAQCRNFIRSLGAKTKSTESTVAAAVELVKSQRRDVAVLGTTFAAEKFALHTLAEKVQDFAENHTRFFVVSKGHDMPSDPTKTLLLVTPSQEHAGVLVNILNVFSALNVNLTWIESRPTKRRLGEYQFFMEVETGAADEQMKKVILILETFGHEVAVLGSY